MKGEWKTMKSGRVAGLKGKLAKKPGMKAAGALSAYVSANKGKK